VCGLAAAGLAQAGVSSRQVDQPGALPSTDTDRLIIKYRDASTAQVRSGQVFSVAKRVDAATLESRSANAQSQAANWGARLSLLRQMGSGAHVYRADKRLSLAQMQALADRIQAADASVEYAEPDRKMFAMLTPNDSSYAQQWDLFEATAGIRAPQAWDLATGTGVVVAVIDTGIRPHADLSGQTVTGYDLINSATIGNDGDARDADPADPGDWVAANECGTGTSASNSSWHGTHVAGTIAAKTNNALGVAGIAFNAKIQPVRVLGKCGGYTSDIADAITWASGGTVSGVPANGTPAKVLNLSLGGSGSCGTTTQTAINGARARGSVVVVAAGNSAVNVSNASPANCSGVIAVAALDRYGARAYYSNYGTAVALAAPGGDMRASASNGILSTLNAGTSTPGADNYAYYQGTSMATPHVAGVAALMFSVKPSATPDQIAAALKSSARIFAGSCSGCGSGMLDAAAAVTAITNTATYPVVTETEANNSRATANAVSAPSDVSGSLASSDTSDYFAISLPAGKTLAATLAAASSTADYDLYVYNASGTQLGSSTLGAGNSDSVSYANGGSAAVTVYVRVARYSGSGAYTLNLRW
jgi:serine protease